VACPFGVFDADALMGFENQAIVAPNKIFHWNNWL
jgi:hypothetical protein